MEFKLNIIINLEATSEQNARHRRDFIHYAIRSCSGVVDIEESQLTTKMPVFEEE